MKQQLKTTFNVIFFTLLVSTAMCYLTRIFDSIPDLNVLECAGIYCLWLPIHGLITSTHKDE